eukprot:gene3833-6993_t
MSEGEVENTNQQTEITDEPDGFDGFGEEEEEEKVEEIRITNQEENIKEDNFKSQNEEIYSIEGNTTTKMNHSSEFTINLKETFPEDFQLSILDPKENNILFNEISEEEKKRVYQFVPISKGVYTILINFKGEEYKHSVSVVSEINIDQSTVAVARRIITHQENIFRLFLKNDEGSNVIDKDIFVVCTGPTKDVKVDVKIDFHKQTTDIVFSPEEEGVHNLIVRIDEQHIKGSPYSFTTISQQEAKQNAVQRYSMLLTKHMSKKFSQKDVLKFNNIEEIDDDDFFDSFEEEEKNQIVSENIELELANQALHQENLELKKQIDFLQSHSGQEEILKEAEKLEMEKTGYEEKLNKSLHQISELEYENKELRRLIDSKDNRIFQLLKENSLNGVSSNQLVVPQTVINNRKSIEELHEDDKAFQTTIGKFEENLKKNTEIIQNAKKYPIILNANIISYQNGKPVYYNIQVQTILETYEVQKRYNEFLSMHQEISKLKGYVFPHFPEKLLLGNQASQNIKKRYDQLQVYLQFIVDKSELLSHEAVQSFLAAPVDEHLI